MRRGFDYGVTCQGKFNGKGVANFGILTCHVIQTVKYFKSIEHVHQSLIGKENLGLQGELLTPEASTAKTTHTRGHEMLVRQLLNAHHAADYLTEEEDEIDKDDKPRPLKRRRS